MVTVRVATEREPKTDTNWEVLADAIRDVVFKSRPTLPVKVLGMSVRQWPHGATAPQTVKG